MLKSFIAVIGAALLLSACDEPAPQAAAPPPPPPPPTFMVFYDWDRANLSTQAMNTLQQAAMAYKSRGGTGVTATGHTDTSGAPEYNMALSVRRANGVKEGLVKEGVPAAAITATGVGEAGLLVKTGDGVREPQNRRVEIVVRIPAAGYNEAAYCQDLMAAWRKTSTAAPAQGPVPEAMADCTAGRFAKGIPVLEKALTDSRVPLPAKKPI
ncbi:MAG: OmpA family protein [Reyranella sp.]|nr:OmpA family protein [Reyranella sp.]